MTGFLDLLSGLTVWWLVSAMARIAGFLECCWGECRGFAQLREGSDDPPPPVRTGASAAWVDATPRPASIPSRMTAIARMRRRRETRCIKPKPLHQTPSGINTACLSKFCLPESRAVFQRQLCIGLQEPMATPAAFSTSPTFHSTTQPVNNTRQHQGHLNMARPRLLLSARERGLILKPSRRDQPVFCRPAATPETVQRIR